MATKALGLIETVGLAAALEAADAMVKAARVELVGYELTRGGGMVLVKIRGDVGAVKAGISAGAAAATLIGRVVSTHIIPRPNSGMEPLIGSVDKMGALPKNNKASGGGTQNELPAGGPTPVIVPAEPEKAAPETKAPEVNPEPEAPIIAEPVMEPADMAPPVEGEPAPGQTAGEEYCNLCGDPKCLRRKGEPRALCIHFGSEKS